jgi:hypothetical protein
MKNLKRGLLSVALSVVMSCVVTIAPYLPVAIVTPIAVSQAGCSAAWIQTALNDLPVLVQIAESILGIVAAAKGNGQIDPGMASQIQSIANQVKTDLMTIQSLVASYQAADATSKPGILGSIDTALGAVQSNLSSILSAFHVSSPVLQATISAAIGLAITTVLAIMSLVPPAPTPTPVAMAARRVPTKPPKPAELRAAYNQVLTVNGYGQFAIH